MMIRLRLMSCLASLMWVAGCCSAQNAEITPEQALQIVNHELRTSGFEAMPPSTTVSAHDRPDNECLRIIDGDDADFRQKAIEALKGRKYFTVLYDPPPPSQGGPIFGRTWCILVDRETGSIISVGE